MATIPRTPMTDDDGSGQVGTIINNAWKTELYNQIDAGLAATLAGGLPEAPTDGTLYGRKSGAWASAPEMSSGLWTPGLTGDSGSGVTFTDRYGYYVKLTSPGASLVMVNGYFVVASLGTAAGTVWLTGFPFPFYGANYTPLSVALWSGAPNLWASMWVRGINSDQRAYIIGVVPGGSFSPGALQIPNLAAGFTFGFQGMYRT